MKDVEQTWYKQTLKTITTFNIIRIQYLPKTFGQFSICRNIGKPILDLSLLDVTNFLHRIEYECQTIWIRIRPYKK